MKILSKYLAIFFLIGLLGCYTAKKADRQLNKAKINYPELVAGRMSMWFPYIQNKGKSDSSEYNLLKKELDSLNRLKIDYSDIKIDTVCKYDTIKKYDTILKKYKEIIYKYRTILKTIPAIHDTVIVSSSADKEIIQRMIEEREDDHKRYDRSSKMNIYFLIALIVSILLHLFRNFKK